MKKEFHAELITIGDELLKGSTLNTNAKFLGKELTDLGFRVSAQTACPDLLSSIQMRIEESLHRSDLIILTGGLGPTPDDLTRDALSAYFNVPLVFSKSQFSCIEKAYKRYGKKVPSMVRKEAMFPEGSFPLINHFGIALGFYLKVGLRLMIVLPGVPMELEKMFANEVRPLIQKHFPGLLKRHSLVVKTIGVSEPDVMTRLKKDFFDVPFDFGIYPQAGEVALRLYAEKKEIIQRLKLKAERRLASDVYAYEETSLAETIGKILTQKRKTLSVAESCSGGMLAQEITRISGASSYFKGGIVAYNNAIKQRVLGVPEEFLKKYGAVSEQVAGLMAQGARGVHQSDYALSITGIAGPDGGTKQKPVGRVYIALATPKNVKVWEKDFWGDRIQVQTKSVKKALEFLWRELSA